MYIERASYRPAVHEVQAEIPYVTATAVRAGISPWHRM